MTEHNLPEDPRYLEASDSACHFETIASILDPDFLSVKPNKRPGLPFRTGRRGVYLRVGPTEVLIGAERALKLADELVAAVHWNIPRRIRVHELHIPGLKEVVQREAAAKRKRTREARRERQEARLREYERLVEAQVAAE